MEISAYIFLVVFSLMCLYTLSQYCWRQNCTKKFTLSFLLILFLIIAVRIFKFSSLPGLDCDEAMGGINSWSLGKYGVDYFNLSKNPVYLFAWGAGMNILYPLITVPFVKAFGLSILTYRFPIIFINLVAIFLFSYAIIRAQWQKKSILISLMVIFLTPWSIQSSRWAVESNLFPPLMIISFSLFIISTTTVKKRKLWLSISMLVIALSAYSYSSNWIFLALFTIFICMWLWKTKFLSIKNILLLAGMYILMLWPLFVFLYVNYISHKQMRVLGLTITKLDAVRSVFVIGNGGDLKAIIKNILDVAKMFISGVDGWPKTGLPLFGALYPFMLTFFFIGIIFYFFRENKTKFDTYMIIMLVSCTPSILLIQPSWTHYNALMLPILYFEYKGVIGVFTENKTLLCFAGIFLITFGLFSFSYFNRHDQELLNGINNTPTELGHMLKKADKSNNNIYLITNWQVNQTNVGAAYVLPLFYTRISPWKFANETSYAKAAEFIQYDHYGKWRLVDGQKVSANSKATHKNSIYIIQNGAVSQEYVKKLKVIDKGEYYTLYKIP